MPHGKTHYSGWDGEYCDACGENVYFSEHCPRDPKDMAIKRATEAKDAAWKVWEAKARKEFEAYWELWGGI